MGYRSIYRAALWSTCLGCLACSALSGCGRLGFEFDDLISGGDAPGVTDASVDGSHPHVSADAESGNDARTTTTTMPAPPCADEPCPWWDDSFENRIALFFDNSGQAAALDEFPVRVSLSQDAISSLCLADEGADLRFISPAGGLPLPYEIERWNPTEGADIWVNIPHIPAASSDSYIFLYCGNENAMTGQDATEVWRNGYNAVWHLAEDRAGGDSRDVYRDSTGQGFHGHDGVRSNDKRGVIGNGEGFDGDEDSISIDGGLLNGAETFTLSTWVRPDDLDNDAAIFRHRSVLGPDTRILMMEDGSVHLELNGDTARTARGVIERRAWGWWTMTFDGHNPDPQSRLRFHLNGEPIDIVSSEYIDRRIIESSLPFQIGRNDEFEGSLDEFRVARVVRSASWLRAQHLSMTGAFTHLGTMEVRP